MSDKVQGKRPYITDAVAKTLRSPALHPATNQAQGQKNESGPELDLLPDVEQEIVMSLPQQPLCKASCLGLCHSCGCNLNQGSCNCEAPILHPGLAALKNFKI